MAKKITAIVSLGVIGALILATIIMACITVNHNINCATPTNGVYVITSSVSVANSGTRAKDEQAETIINYINEASKESSLTALFSGRLFSSAELKTSSSSVSNIRTGGTTLTTPSSAGYSYFVCYKYSTPQVLMDGNTKITYTDDDGNEVSYTYQELYFGITETDGVAEVNVYVISDELTNTTTYKYYYYYVLYADFDELYSYLSANF